MNELSENPSKSENQSAKPTTGKRRGRPKGAKNIPREQTKLLLPDVCPRCQASILSAKVKDGSRTRAVKLPDDKRPFTHAQLEKVVCACGQHLVRKIAIIKPL